MVDDEWQYEPEEFDDPEQLPPTASEGDADSASADLADDPETDAGGWRFSLEDLESDGTPGLDRSLSGTVEPGSPDLENAVFVALGLALGFVVAWQFLV